MRSTWPYLAAVVAVGVGVGTWVAGLPQSSTGITIADGVAPGGAGGVGGENTVALLPTSSFPPITVTPTTEPTRNPVPPSTTPDTTTPDTTAPDTTAPDTTAPDTTTPATTTTATTTTATTATAPTTAPTTTAVATDVLLDRAQVRLVLANGDGRYNLVGRNVDRLTPLGYITIDQTDAPRNVARTVLYIRPGFDDEAVRLAADLLVPGALIEPLPDQPVTINDQLGDIIVVLGPDAVR